VDGNAGDKILEMDPFKDFKGSNLPEIAVAKYNYSWPIHNATIS